MREYQEIAVDEDSEWEMMKAHALVEPMPVGTTIEEAVLNFLEATS